MTRRWIVAIAALVMLEVGVFYASHGDLVALTRSEASLAADPAFPSLADDALARPRLSRRVLERIADVAGRRADYARQALALERIAAQRPEDVAVQLRLAEALRAQGRLAEAEAIYRTELARLPAEGRQ